MGWTECRASYFYDNGTINRKKECDAYFEESLNRGFYKVIKSRMVGSIYYGAIMPLKRCVKDATGNKLKYANGDYVYEEIPGDEREVFGVVILTSVNNKSFAYKIIDESMGPCESNCPKTILKLLTPTTHKYAKEWRKRCEDNLKKPNLAKLPIGSEIEFEINGTVIKLRKSAPKCQFKTPFWINDTNYTYFSKKRIPGDFKVVSMPTT
jgi:hypothetical protein